MPLRGIGAQIDLNKAFRSVDVQRSILPVHMCDKLLRRGNQDLGAVVIDLHDGVVADFQKPRAGADFAEALVCDGEADNFVEVELVAGQWGKLLHGEINLHGGEVAAVVRTDGIELDDELVVAPVGDMLDGVGDFLAVEVKEERVELGVALGIVGFKKGTQIPFQSERSGQCA